MQMGLIGLGRMGGGIRGRLRAAGHEVFGYDRLEDGRDVASLREVVAALRAPRVVWSMVPAGTPTDQVVSELSALMEPGDVLIDGGNSRYTDSIRRGAEVSQLGLHFMDAGTSGGIHGLEHGFCLMIGGPREAFELAEPLFAALAAEEGYAHVGGVGAGHFTKMVHNGIEYGMMQAMGEGFALMRAYEEPLDLRAIAHLWNRGSVVRSWLMELAESALEKDPQLERLHGYVEDSGEGRWIVEDAVVRGVSLSVIAQSLFARFASREADAYALRMLAALRAEFGGHAFRPAS